MGCACSKRAALVEAASPVNEYSAAAHGAPNDNRSLSYVYSSKNPSGLLELDPKVAEEEEQEKSDDHRGASRELKKSKKGSSQRKNPAFTIKLGFNQRHVDAEQIAAGWPAWLTAAAGEAVHGLVPLRAESFEKLEKIGQGTYSSVFKARDVANERMVALKKVRFDNFQPESIRFMAREILILRRLDHPNIIKLEGVITSRLSTTIYLVFEYMEHDLAGLLSSPDIKFSEPQVKCYMKQLLHGIEHCHLRGIMHRDIKSSNILLNNDGVLKLGDFGLANILTPKNKQRLTSRVVTLWYRPPELLMGSTNYNVSVDLWSIGCVFSELLLGKPILKGRTEVEQLHKIFKLCGSPPEEFWRRSKLPHGNMFKPQQAYEGTLHERCKDFPTTTVNLVETLLSIDPQKRRTASSALMSEYFHTQPYACDASSLPKYPPKKEIDAKQRDEARRKKVRPRVRDSSATKKPRRPRATLQDPSNFGRLPVKEEPQDDISLGHRPSGHNAHIYKERGSMGQREPLKPYDSETSQATSISRGHSVFTVPVQVSASSGFEWAKHQNNEDVITTLSSKSQISAVDQSNLGFANNTISLTKDEDRRAPASHAKGQDQYETSSRSMQMRPTVHSTTNSFDLPNIYYSQDFPTPTFSKEEGFGHGNDQGQNDREKIEFSGPLLSGSTLYQSDKVDELLQRNESNIRRVVRRSRFYRER